MDQPGIARAKFRRAQPEGALRAAAKAFDQHIGTVDQGERLLPALGRRKVEHNALLAPVPHAEAWHFARPVARRGLDLDHARTVVSQQLAGKRAGHALAQFDDLEAFENGAQAVFFARHSDSFRLAARPAIANGAQA